MRVKCYTGLIKVLTICVVLLVYTASQKKNWGYEGGVTYLEILHP